MYQAEDYQLSKSKYPRSYLFTTDTQVPRLEMTVTLFPMVFDRLATTTEHGICRL